MKRNTLSFYAIIVAISLLTACSSSWDAYVYDKAGFTVDMPGKPKVESGFERISQTSSLTTTTYTNAPLFSDESYLVYIGKFSSWSLGGVKFDLESGKQGMRESIKQQGGSVISEGPAELAGRTAWEFKIKVKELEGALRVFVEDMTIYGLQELHKEGNDVSGNAERFFSSFIILEEG
jgi:hypothetical protein